ncbi:hypothetical protein [Methylocella tundrae]|uniref:Uncharacterized protein n=1 Tax=Methylocella tundrae TaxID=227605 RepID=A0A4U8Z7T9_METTU|nr:hypothetical protein [Methylocella tundrae]WPP02817.1 hypothetical protein SIN04_00470 [Methylocella tundrae]VFU17621.1 conserved protein of unknown function [Methylocella tundrae]
MTLHLARSDVGVIDAEGDELPVALPGETAAPFAIFADERPVVQSGSAIRSLRDRLNGAVISMQGRLRRKPDQSGEEVDEGEVAAASTVNIEEGAVGSEAPPASAPAAPLWRRPAFIGAASIVALAAAAGGVFVSLSGETAKPVQVSEVGVPQGGPPHPALMAPAAALATVPEREATDAAGSRPAVVGERNDQLTEILSFKQDPVKKGEPTTPALEKTTSAGAPVEQAAKAASAQTTHEEVKTADATPKSETSAAAAAPATERKAEAVILETGSAGSKPRIGNDVDVRVASVRTDEMKAVAPPPAPIPPAAPSIAPAQASAAVDGGKKDTEALALVTEFGTLLREVKAEVVALKAAQVGAAAATESKINDFERRLSLSEAKRAIESVKAVGEATGDAVQAKTTPAPGKSIGPSAPGIRTASLTMQAPAPAAADEQRRYRIQAASPGLAMLAAIDGPGDQEGPLQVAIGASIPGYGKVKSIDQRGAAWVVQTERGVIQ